jgi:hypothetical protein
VVYLRRMKTILSWPQNHPVAFPLILFLLASGISVYASDIKRFIHEWPRNKLKEISRRNLEQRLANLKLMHNNVYELSLFVYQQLATGFIAGIIIGFAISNAALLVLQHFSVAPFFTALAGTLFGSALNIKHMVTQLQHYNAEIARLSTELSELDTLRKN